MSAVILKILSFIGILLLSLLGLLLVLCLLVLFFPIRYRVNGKRDAQEMFVRLRAGWLFGFLRAEYDYPKPGRLKVKLLCFTVYRSAEEEEETELREASEEQTSYDAAPTRTAKESPSGESSKAADTASNRESSASAGQEAEAVPGFWERFLAKCEKIKYTIRKIYDKIKDILENFSYYRELFQEEETKALLKYASLRLGKILKSIRPKKLDAEVLFGMESPDSTGYLYALYSVFYPSLGQSVLVTPDFTRSVLEGRIDAAGYITVFTVAWNVIRVLLDKRFDTLVKKIKAHRK